MFKDYPLDERVIHALEARSFTTPTTIQAATLGHSLEGRDILGQARTGTGKTLAFALPIASRLAPERGRGRAPRALVLAPTRELALQVAGELKWVASHLTVATIYGGTGYGSQSEALKRGADVIVATPGRALDYLRQGILNLAAVEIVVLDEADEMLSMGFEEDVETILAATPGKRQTMLFSATLPAWARRLSERHLRDPITVSVVKDERISYREIAIEIPRSARTFVLSDILHAYAPARAIVFTRTKTEVDELAQALGAKGHGAEAVHGDLSQIQRERVVSRFRSGQATVLVATDVAARGLDIPEVDLVVHYRLPEKAEAYQHRSGRTGRAGRAGTVVLLHEARERRELKMLERAVSRRFDEASPPRPQEVQEAKLAGLGLRLAAQREEDKELWRDVAERWVEEGEVEALAGLLALVLGGVPASRSLLTGEEGWTTMKLSARSTGQAVRVLKDAGAGDIGRIQLAGNDAFVDLRPAEVRHLELHGLKLAAATKLPAATGAPGRARGRDRSVNSRY